MTNGWRVESRVVNAAAPDVAAFRHVLGGSDGAAAGGSGGAAGSANSAEGIWLDSSLPHSEHYGRTFSILCPTGGPLNAVVECRLAGSSASSLSSFSDANYSITGTGPLADRLRAFVADSETGAAGADTADGIGGKDGADLYDLLRYGLSLVDTQQMSGPEVGSAACGFDLGWVGAFGYELKHLSPAVRQSPTAVSDPHVSEFPEALLMLADRAVIIDHAEQRTHLLALTSDDGEYSEIHAVQMEWLDEMCEVLEQLASAGARSTSSTASAATAATSPDPEGGISFRFDHSRAEYLDRVREAQAFIAAGETYELCLTTTAEGAAVADPSAAYLQLREASPVPYGAYINLAGTHVLSASPERFLKVTANGRISAKPIKGTRGRSSEREVDEYWRRELKNNTKDRAENLMIVDLLRNDLSIVAAPGSVRVPSLFAVETYSHVHQLVSTVEAQLAVDKTAVDLLAAAFPGGSMTGAPKVRTMELIEGMEHRARGLYSGAIGWLGFGGAADLSITIRTVVGNAERATFGVGGAIVADSTPEGEWEEIVVKSQAMLQGLKATREER